MDFTWSRGLFGSNGWDQHEFAREGRDYSAYERRAALGQLDRLATVLDIAFIMPGTNIRFGVEALICLVPGIGDAAASLLSSLSTL